MNKKIRIVLFALIAMSFHPKMSFGESLSVGIIGDSLATGAGTHPALAYDSKDLWEVFLGKTKVDANVHQANGLDEFGIGENPEAPPMLWRGTRQFYGSLDWVFFNTLDALSSLYLNTEQYSWGYMVARSLGAEPKDIYIAAENGAKVEKISVQADKIISKLDGYLPEKLLIMFNGNDLCAPNEAMTTSVEDFQSNLLSGIEYILENGKEHPNGTEIIVGGFLGVTQLIGDKKILAKKVNFYGEQLSCKEVRTRLYLPKDERLTGRDLPPEAIYFARVIPPNPANICSTLFGAPAAVNPQLSILANRIHQYRKAEKDVMTGLEKSKSSKYSDRRVKFTYADGTEKLLFNPEDIAGDCFHLSIGGQKRVAKAILKSLEVK